MSKRTLRPLISIAAFFWAVVGGYGLWQVVAEDANDNWEFSYSIFAIGLVLGALLTVVAFWSASRPAERPLMRSIGLGVCALGVLSTIVAWALPLWMTLFAIGFALLAFSGSQPWRRPAAFLAGSQVLGLAIMFIAHAAELGPSDEYGDYPAAIGIGLVVTAAGTLMSLYQLDRSVSASMPPTSTGVQTAA